MTQSAPAIATARIERFLTALANLRDDDEAALKGFAARFGNMLTDVPAAEAWGERSEAAAVRALQTLRDASNQSGLAAMQAAHTAPHSIPPLPPVADADAFIRISELSTHVRRIWRASTPQEKTLRVLLLHEIISSIGKPTFLLSAAIGESLCPIGPFAESILYLLKSADRALVCKNPGCPAPLFFRNRKKRRQTYCSTTCAGFGQRQAKLKWWAEKGDKRRKAKRQRPTRSLGKERKRQWPS